uniref:Uncharacterized protein n=1 Tax=Corethron hystrix TaxID=216773 RepID=A0A7S1FX78_9STRA|mmetsp:Transcript_36311/g.84948  ORF Transcript_36311/g.84948 Transcript_36311/m.84948 type:complete len:227 (+) Transcript_36311:2-682(+)
MPPQCSSYQQDGTLTNMALQLQETITNEEIIIQRHIPKKNKKNEEYVKPTLNIYHRLFYNFEDFWKPNIKLWDFFHNSLTDNYFKRKWNDDLTESQQTEILERLTLVSTKFEKYRAANQTKKRWETLAISSTGLIIGSLGVLGTVGIPCVIASAGGFHLNNVRKDRYKRDIVNYYLQCQEEGERGGEVGDWVSSFIHVFADGNSCSISRQFEQLYLLKKLSKAEFV